MVRLPSGAFRRRVVPQGVGTAAFGSPGSDLKGVSGAGLPQSRKGSASPSCCEPPQLSARADPQRRCLEDAYAVEDSVLGSGGFGTVRRAQPRIGGQACVVKTLPKCSRQGSSDDYLAENARHEAEVLRRLDHDKICKIIDVYEDDKNVYLVLEYIQGCELFDDIAENGPMTERRAAGIMRQLFEALEHCHEADRSVLHRDLKPENVMVGQDDAVKIIDFGLAAICPEDGMLQTSIVGTAEYLAPEALADGLYSRASDLWSAGAVLHMILTGGALPSQVGRNRCNVELLEELQVSRAAQELLEGLLGSRPEDRLTALEARMHPWTQGTTFKDDLPVVLDHASPATIFVDAALVPEICSAARSHLAHSVQESDVSQRLVEDAATRGQPQGQPCSGTENMALQVNGIDDLCKTSCCESEKLHALAACNFKENVLPSGSKASTRRRGNQPPKQVMGENIAHAKMPLRLNFNEADNQRRPLLLR